MTHISEKDWVPVTGSMYLKEADVITELLDTEGIPAKQASPNDNQNYRSFAARLDTAQVLVPKEYLARARAFLDAKEKEAEGK